MCGALSPPRILIVDDSPVIRAQLRTYLRNAGAEAMAAEDASSALALVTKNRFDAVFLDVILPESPHSALPSNTDAKLPREASSLGLLRKIFDADPTLCVVVTTALSREHPDVIHAMSLGAAQYMHKPLRADDVRETLDALLAERA